MTLEGRPRTTESILQETFQINKEDFSKSYLTKEFVCVCVCVRIRAGSRASWRE